MNDEPAELKEEKVNQPPAVFAGSKEDPVQEEVPDILQMDAEVVELWIVDANFRIRGMFDEVHLLGDGLENSNGRSGIPELILGFLRFAIKPGGVVFVPKALEDKALAVEMLPAPNKPPKGFLAFTY